LPRAQRQRVEAHLESCGSCRQHHEGLLSLRNLIQQTPSLLPPDNFFKKWVPSSAIVKVLLGMAVILLALWLLRKHHGPQMDLRAKLTSVRPVAVKVSRPVPLETAAAPVPPRTDPNVQDLQQLANTLPPATTAPAEPVATPTAPAVVPETTSPVPSPAAP
jgi:hypothetical protein